MQARSLLIRISEGDRPRLDDAARRAGFKTPREYAEWLLHWALEQLPKPPPPADVSAS